MVDICWGTEFPTRPSSIRPHAGARRTTHTSPRRLNAAEFSPQIVPPRNCSTVVAGSCRSKLAYRRTSWSRLTRGGLTPTSAAKIPRLNILCFRQTFPRRHRLRGNFILYLVAIYRTGTSWASLEWFSTLIRFSER